MNRLMLPGFRLSPPPQTNAFRRRVDSCAVPEESLPWSCPHSCCSSCILASAQGQLESKYQIHKRYNNSAFSIIQQRQQLTFYAQHESPVFHSQRTVRQDIRLCKNVRQFNRNVRHKLKHFLLRQSGNTGGGGCLLWSNLASNRPKVVDSSQACQPLQLKQANINYSAIVIAIFNNFRTQAYVYLLLIYNIIIK